ncbi:MAG: hypothetical protein H7329_06420 [Opitutaceae bacterium]|nr:hypothetical protein [Cytophagales bacterium]
MFIWEKQGIVKNVIEQLVWAKTHAQVPTLLLLEDRLRVYFSTRPEAGMTMTTFCDLDLNDLTKVIYVHDKPILDLGEPGCFDQFGIMPSSIIKKDGLVYLFYSGWARSVGVPYNNYTGIAISKDDGLTFKKMFQGPVLERTKFELFSATSPEVMYDGNSWHTWYCSGTNWHHIDGKFEHTYDIKYAKSLDGINWIQLNETVIFQKDEYEAITKPTVIAIDGTFHMWFCYRGTFDFRKVGETYSIGYASSSDLKNWKRDDAKSGIAVSESGWDSQMVAYPAVIKIKDDYFMFYNGNNFGTEGFGIAKLKK